MLAKLAKRLGFQQSLPVSLIEQWHVPELKRAPIELAPRGGAASCWVDQYGRLQASDATWSLEFTLAAGARWVASSQSDRVTQRLVGAGVIETTVETPSGPVVQRVAAGVVDGEPVAIVEIENRGGVAVGVGLVARPLLLEGRGHVTEIAVDAAGIRVDGTSAVRFGAAPASVRAIGGAEGDLLAALPEPDDLTSDAAARCRSGGAQAAAVWPLPHTAALRFVVELANPVSTEAAVPSTDDINRGWDAHLGQGMRIDVDGLPLGDHLAVALRTALTSWPSVADAPQAVLALSESGFGRDAGRFFDILERHDDDAAVVRSLARWSQLGEQAQQLDDLERILGRLAQAAHRVAGNGTALVGPPWLADALVVLGGRLHQIDQPDVAGRVQSLPVDQRSIEGAESVLVELTKELDKRGVWPREPGSHAMRYVRAARSIVAEDTGAEVRVLGVVPHSWRGRSVDVLGLPLSTGTMAFGLRWHGPRPALLWEASLVPEAPFELTVPGIDGDFRSTDREGEVLLSDPGWS